MQFRFPDIKHSPTYLSRHAWGQFRWLVEEEFVNGHSIEMALDCSLSFSLLLELP